MALQKTYELPSGISGNYWRIFNIQLMPETQTVSLQVGLYADAQTREDGKLNLYCIYYNLGNEEYQTWFSPAVLDQKNPYKSAYDYLKARPEFADSVDV